MAHPQNALLHCLLAVCVAVLAFGCPGSGGGPGGPSLDSNTNWLTECSADTECGGELTCECGVCTTRCDDDCTPFVGGVCVGAGDAARDQICPADVPPICLRGCFADPDCGDGYICTEQRCLPDWSRTQQDISIEPDAGQIDADPSDAGEDTEPDIAPDVEPDVIPDVAPDVTEDATEDVPPTDTGDDADVSLGPCPGGGSLICGARISATREEIYRCEDDGSYTLVDTCAVDCVFVDGGDDVCVDACETDLLLPFCGDLIGLPADHLYACSSGRVVSLGECLNGCDPDGGRGGNATCR